MEVEEVVADTADVLSMHTQHAHQRRYHGLLIRSPLKNLRDRVFRFLDYLGANAAPHSFFLHFLSYYFCFQTVFISLLTRNSNFWHYGSTMPAYVVNLISVVSLLIPASASNDLFRSLVLAYECVAFVMVATIICSFVVFNYQSKLPTFIISVVSLIFNGVWFYWSHLLTGYMGGALFQLTRGGNGLLYTIIVIGLLLVVTVPFFLKSFVASGLVLRPQIIHTTSGAYLERDIWLHFFSTFLVIFGSLFGGIAGTICVYGSAGFLVIRLLMYHLAPYELASLDELQRTAPFDIASVLMRIVFQSLSMAGYTGDEISLVITICLVLLSMFVYRQLFKRNLIALHHLCELSASDIDFFESLPYRKAVMVAKLSFELGLPTSHQWHLFQSLLRRYKDDHTVMILFARYAALYASEDTMLRLAAMRVASLKVGRLDFKRLLFDILSLIQQRESELSERIRKALNRMRDQTGKVRNQIRYLWEGVIRGSLDRFESLCVHIKSAETEIIYDFNQLCLIYPNNPFIAQAYG
jgi:hypothetical protein